MSAPKHQPDFESILMLFGLFQLINDFIFFDYKAQQPEWLNVTLCNQLWKILPFPQIPHICIIWLAMIWFCNMIRERLIDKFHTPHTIWVTIIWFSTMIMGKINDWWLISFGIHDTGYQRCKLALLFSLPLHLLPGQSDATAEITTRQLANQKARTC